MKDMYKYLIETLFHAGFDGVVCRHRQNNAKHVVYDGWKVGMLYIMSVYGGHQGANNARVLVVSRKSFVYI